MRSICASNARVSSQRRGRLTRSASRSRVSLSDRRPRTIASFNPSAGEFADLVRSAFPEAEITFEGDRYLVVPQAAILTLVREEDDQEEDLLSF